jgi:hypothetical protein
MSLLYRVGCFFLLIGFLGLIIFVTTDISHLPQFDILLISLPVIILGYLMWRKGKPEPKASTRFRLINRLRSGKKDQTEEDLNGE